MQTAYALVIDDDANRRNSLITALTSDGWHHFFEAVTSEERNALLLALQSDIALVISSGHAHGLSAAEMIDDLLEDHADRSVVIGCAGPTAGARSVGALAEVHELATAGLMAPPRASPRAEPSADPLTTAAPLKS